MRLLKPGDTVIGSDGSRLGAVERLVIDEASHRITHVVVSGRLVGLGRLRDAGAGGLAADLGRAELERLPEPHDEFVSPPGRHWRPPAGYVLQSFLAVANALVGQAPYTPPVEADLDLGSEHEIVGGSPVWSGTTRIGEVERVESDESGALVGLVVRRGWRGPRVKVPPGRVTEVVGTNVHTDLSPAEVDELPEADPE